MPTDVSLQVGVGGARAVAVLVLFAVALLVAVRTGLMRGAIARSPARLGLFLLRLGALLAITLLLLDPTLRVERSRSVRPRVVVAVDRSLSMSLPVSGGPDRRETRIERAERVLEESGVLDRIRSEADVDYVVFAGEPRRVSGDSLFADPSGLAGGSTDLAGALAWIAEQIPGADAVIVVTDGRVNAGGDPRVAMRGLPPVLFVGVGRAEGRPDADLVAVRAPESVYEGSPIPFEVTLRTVGGTGGALRVTVAEGERTIRTIRVEPGRGERFRDLRFSLTGEAPGRHEYRIGVEGGVEDAFPGNDGRMAVVEVVSTRSDALVVSVAPRWDLTFFLDAVQSLEYLRVDRLLLEPGAAAGLLSSGDGAPPRRVSIRDIDPGRYELLCLQGGPIPPALLLEARGRSPGSEARTRGAILLWTDPVEAPSAGMEGSGAVRSGRTGVGGEFVEGTFEVVPPTGDDLPLPGTRAAWASLPPLLAAVDPGPGADRRGITVLTVRDAKGRELPAVVVEERGGVRIVSLLGRGYWRWAFHRPAGEAADRLYEEMVDELVRWSLGSDAAPGTIRIEPVRGRFERGEKVEFVRKGDGAAAFLRVEREGGGAAPESIVVEAGAAREARIRGGPLPPGTWRYRYGPRGGTSAGGGLFTVDTYSREFSDAEPDAGRLGELGAVDGAAYVPISDITGQNVGNYVALGNSHRRLVDTYAIAHSPLTYMVALIALILEILVRKRRGFS